MYIHQKTMGNQESNRRTETLNEIGTCSYNSTIGLFKSPRDVNRKSGRHNSVNGHNDSRENNFD